MVMTWQNENEMRPSKARVLNKHVKVALECFSQPVIQFSKILKSRKAVTPSYFLVPFQGLTKAELSSSFKQPSRRQASTSLEIT